MQLKQQEIWNAYNSATINVSKKVYEKCIQIQW